MSYDIKLLAKDLKLLDHIEGLEKINLPINPLWIETFRRMDGLYRELSIARLNLLMAAKEEYHELAESGKNDIGFKTMQYSFVNTAIIWYNNSFDLLLQVVWVYYMMWVESPEIKVSNDATCWNIEQIEKMKRMCEYKKVERWNKNNENKVDPIINLYNSATCKKIREWANCIKHRAPLFIDEVCDESIFRIASFDEFTIIKNTDGGISINFSLDEEKYDSRSSFRKYSMEELLSDLIEYHKELCDCIDMIASEILYHYKTTE